VNLSSVIGATLGASASETAQDPDDDGPPGLQVVHAAIAEGNTGTSTLAVHVQLSAPSGHMGQVAAHTGDRTATVGSDYVEASAITIKLSDGDHWVRRLHHAPPLASVVPAALRARTCQ
jgi:hypothetical protein